MHSLLRNVNDMGELRSEHRGNFTYWMTVASSRWCGLCSCFGAVVLAYLLLDIVPQAKAKPEEIPPFFFEMVIVSWVFIFFFVLFLVYAIRSNRRNPLLFALYEKGLLVVYRNRTTRRVFWNDIVEIQRLETKPFGWGKPVFQGISLHLRPDEQGRVVRPVSIRVEYFQNVEQLCHAICEAKEAS